MDFFTVGIQGGIRNALSIQCCPILLQMLALLLDDAQQLCHLLSLQCRQLLRFCCITMLPSLCAHRLCSMASAAEAQRCKLPCRTFAATSTMAPFADDSGRLPHDQHRALAGQYCCNTASLCGDGWSSLKISGCPFSQCRHMIHHAG